MYASHFTYNIQRPYPYRWFTPVVLVVGLIATVLFSVINLAVNGYQLKTVYVTDPNATESQGHWYTSGPFGLNSKLKPSCEPQNLLLGTQLFTSNQGLSYTITKIQLDVDGIPEPALLYLNNTLEDCRVENVTVDVGRSDQSPPSSPDADQVNWWTWGDSSATAAANCVVKTHAGLINVALSTTISPQKRGYDYVLKIPTNTSSVWWATRVSNLYFVGTMWTMTFASTGSDILFDHAQFRFTLNNTQTIKSPDLFNLAYDFNDDDQIIYNAQSLAPVSQLYNNADLKPNVSATATEALGFAKAFYSLVLLDLGQKETPNLFLDEDLLKYALDAPDDIFRTADSEWLGSDRVLTTLDANEYCTLCAPDDAACNNWIPMNKSYAAFKDQLGPLDTTAATIYMQYSCSVPQARSGGTVFVTVLLADLVFLQALWSLFNVITAWFMRRRFPESNLCERCLRGGEDLPLVEVGALQGNNGFGESVEVVSPRLPPLKNTSGRGLLGMSEQYQYLRPSSEA